MPPSIKVTQFFFLKTSNYICELKYKSRCVLMNEKGTGILKDRETQVEKFVLSKLSTRYRKDNFELFNRF